MWVGEVSRRVMVEQDQAAPARLVEWDADPSEVELYESACAARGPLIDRAQRSRAGQYERHGVGSSRTAHTESANAPANTGPGLPRTTLDGLAMKDQVIRPIWTALDSSSLTRN